MQTLGEYSKYKSERNKMEIKKEKYDCYYEYSAFPKVVLLRVPVVTVCYLLADNDDVGRGIAICSREDEFNETIGRRLAKRNAIRAMKGRSIVPIRCKKAIERLIKVKCPFIKKGELNPALSWWERKFLFGRKKMYAFGGIPTISLWPCYSSKREYYCHLIFKSHLCCYRGSATVCNKTLKRCRELKNIINFDIGGGLEIYKRK